MDGTGGRDEDLSPAEAARIGRRERERKAKARELMRTGQAKTFKQILDAQARRAADTTRPSRPAAEAPRSVEPPPADGDVGDRKPSSR